MGSASSLEQPISFGPFRLFPRQRLLAEGNTPLRVGSRALDILIALVERQGEVVSKIELMNRVWPDTHVEEINLRVHMATLRRVMGDRSGGNRFIVSVPNRGYAFVAPVLVENADASALPKRESHRHNLPISPTRLVGRQESLTVLMGHLRRHRLLTIVGAGGTGKTCVALATAKELIGAYEHGVWLADLAQTSKSELVPNAVAAIFGVEAKHDDMLPSLVHALRDRKVLVVLDNCEHVIEGAARLAAGIMSGTSHVRMLATSREPLRVEGENVHRLRPLECPDELAAADPDRLRKYSAVELFIERAIANDLELKDADIPAIADICRKLDGIPLAIEFAAAYGGTLGVHNLATLLESGLLSAGRRSASERHQTLRAAHDWSYALLSEPERAALRRFSTFAGAFTLDAAIRFASGDSVGTPEVLDIIANLVSKSLVAADTSGSGARYRLLETTRVYALEKLREADEFEAVVRRHAAYFSDILHEAWRDRTKLFEAGGYATFKDQIGNLRAALQWCFSPEGDEEIGIKLAASACFCLMDLGLTIEAKNWSERALKAMDSSLRGTRYEAMLQYVHAHCFTVVSGNAEASDRAIEKAIELANAVGEQDLELRILGGYHIVINRTSDVTKAMPIAVRAAEVAREINEPDALAMAHAMLCLTHHASGNQIEAEMNNKAALEYAPLNRKINTMRYGIDHRVRSMNVASKLHFLRGQPAQAIRTARDVLDFAQRAGAPIGIVMAAYFATETALLCGDWSWAGDVIALTGAVASEHSIQPFPMLASAYGAELAFRMGAKDTLPAQEAAFEKVVRAQYNPFQQGIGVIEALIRAERFDDADHHIGWMIDAMEQKGAGAYRAEYIRLRGDLLAARGAFDEARKTYERVLAVARKQGALAWELRAAVGLARLDRTGLQRDTGALLLSAYERYAKDYETPDLRAAKELLAEFGQ
ncbi:MAG: winged helix-turn-helix domain-containing protein [Rhizomicrobium sp.]